MRTEALEALSADVHLLGDQLGDVIRRLAGQDAYDLVEEVRAAVKDLRPESSLEAARRLRDRLGTLDLGRLRTLIRAFSIYFDLINLAEQQARVRAIRARQRDDRSAPMSESPVAALEQLRDRGVDANQVAEHLSRALVRPVFTAHPSEARRRTILEKLAAIAQQLDRIELGQLVPSERERAVASIAEEVETLWLSETVREARPTVLDEVRQGLGMVEGNLLDVVPRLYRNVEAGLRRTYPGREWDVPPFLQFGSWIGGDRDGHPGVSSTTTAEAIRLQQESLLNQYLARMDDLWRRLSHARRADRPGPALRDSLAKDSATFPDLRIATEAEPYRAKCRLISAKIRKTLDYVSTFRPTWAEEHPEVPAGVYLGRADLLADLNLIADDLTRTGASAAAHGAIRDMIRLVEVFGVHLLTLDLRQHSDRHTEALDEILREAGVCPNFAEMSPEGRFACLAKELEGARSLIPTRLRYSDETNEVIRTFRTVADILERQCPEAMSTYIISSATEPSHLLEVLLLAHEAGLFRPEEGVSRLDIVPLFEALAPLQTASAIIETLLALPVYRRHLSLRGDFQEVMIGYSDSGKESGSLQSAWALYRAQTDLVETGHRAGVSMQMFHGRGGAIGRGGGPANHAILAQPRGTVDGRLRMTEQGEVIADRYGHPGIAQRHLEQVIHAVLHTSFLDEDEQPRAEWSEILDRMAPVGAGIIEGWSTTTPTSSPTSARPRRSRRSSSSRSARGRPGGADRRPSTSSAIPWVFSWMQCRHTLPGWYGLGTALDEHLKANPDDLATLREMYLKWPFWRTLIDNAQMILSKADMTIARLYADLVADQEIAGRIYGAISSEYDRAVAATLLISGQETLLEQMPILQLSIQRRNPYVDALSFLQLVLLKRLRAGEEPRDELLTAVLESINGVASGLKNTG